MIWSEWNHGWTDNLTGSEKLGKSSQIRWLISWSSVSPLKWCNTLGEGGIHDFRHMVWNKTAVKKNTHSMKSSKMWGNGMWSLVVACKPLGSLKQLHQVSSNMFKPRSSKPCLQLLAPLEAKTIKPGVQTSAGVDTFGSPLRKWIHAFVIWCPQAWEHHSRAQRQIDLWFF